MSIQAQQQRTRVAAYGLLYRDGHILLCRISERLPGDAGRWTLPGGGVDFGEDPADAMMREVREETGLVVEAGSVQAIDSIVSEKGAAAFHGIRILYSVRSIRGALAFEVDGTTDRCAWVRLDAAREMPLVGLAEVGRRIVERACGGR